MCVGTKDVISHKMQEVLELFKLTKLFFKRLSTWECDE